MKRENKAKKNQWRFAMQREEKARQAIAKSIARHNGTQDKKAAWGKAMAFARQIARECQPAIDAKRKAEDYLFHSIVRAKHTA